MCDFFFFLGTVLLYYISSHSRYRVRTEVRWKVLRKHVRAEREERAAEAERKFVCSAASVKQSSRQIHVPRAEATCSTCIHWPNAIKLRMASIRRLWEWLLLYLVCVRGLQSLWIWSCSSLCIVCLSDCCSTVSCDFCLLTVWFMVNFHMVTPRRNMLMFWTRGFGSVVYTQVPSDVLPLVYTWGL